MLPGLRVGNEILIINGEPVSVLDLRQMELLFSEKSVMLTLTTTPNSSKSALCPLGSEGDISRETRSLLPPPNQSQLLEEFLDNFKKNTANGEIFSFCQSRLFLDYTNDLKKIFFYMFLCTKAQNICLNVF